MDFLNNFWVFIAICDDGRCTSVVQYYHLQVLPSSSVAQFVPPHMYVHCTYTDTIYDFLCEFSMKPHVHLVSIIIFSQYHVIVRPMYRIGLSHFEIWAGLMAALQAGLKTQECQHNLSAIFIGINQNSINNIA